MSLLKLIAPFWLLPTLVFAQHQGIAFETGTWKETLAKAKAENKLVFLDGYTTWCGPCKKLDRDVYPLQEVGDFYNKNFINTKIDMEKGEGIDIAKQYAIRAYPTLLFLDHNGTVVHRTAGYVAPDDFIALGKTANDPSQNLAAMQARFDAGDRDPDFLMAFTDKRFEAMDKSHLPIAEAYLKTQNDWKAEKNIRFIYKYTSNASSELFQFIMHNRPSFYQYFPQKEVDTFVEELIYNKIYSSDPKPSIENIEGILKEAFPDRYKLLFANFKMGYYRQLGDRTNYALAAAERFDKFPSKDAGELNDAAWTFYRVIDDPDMLNKAVKWARRSHKISREYANADTVAALYFKLGKKSKALKYANRAIAIAKKDGDDYSETQALLEKIKQLP
jgi:thiol-disulfide isomerase/thioredoxin